MTNGDPGRKQSNLFLATEQQLSHNQQHITVLRRTDIGWRGRDMAWWKLFCNPVEVESVTAEEKFEDSAMKNFISEPVRSIVKAMTTDRKRFVVQTEYLDGEYSKTNYAILDIDTEEEFFVRSIFYSDSYHLERTYYGPSWATNQETQWAVNTIFEHYRRLRARAKRITAARERNRLIEIYAR